MNSNVPQTSVKEAVDEYLFNKQHSLTNKTRRWYTQKLNIFSACCERNGIRLDQVKARTVQSFVQSLPPEYSTYTKHGYVQVVKGFLNWCVDEEDFEHCVSERSVKKIELPKVEHTEIEIFTSVQIKSLFNACEKMPYPVRDKAIISLLLDTGMRVSELAYDTTRPEETTGLRMGNVYLEPFDTHLKIMGKGRKEREVGLGDQARIALRRYITRYRGKSQSPYVFLGRTGEPLSVRGVELVVSRLGEIARVPYCHCHRFRHTFAVTYLLNGGNELMLMKIMGHTSLNATQVYARAMTQTQARSGKSVLDSLK